VPWLRTEIAAKKGSCRKRDGIGKDGPGLKLTVNQAKTKFKEMC
jgi:hypothetical protein